MEEVFKDVSGFEDYFQISNFGNVFSKRSNKLLKIHLPKGKGYASFTTKIGGRLGETFNLKIHRLVAIAFVENPLNKNEVNHIDGNKLNNMASNLEWVTQKENISHAKSLGLFKTAEGILNSQSKLTENDISFIRGSSASSRELAAILGVSHPTILRVKNGISYKNTI